MGDAVYLSSIEEPQKTGPKAANMSFIY